MSVSCFQATATSEESLLAKKIAPAISLSLSVLAFKGRSSQKKSTAQKIK